MIYRPDWRHPAAIPFLAIWLMVAGCSDRSGHEKVVFDSVKAAQRWNTADKTWPMDELEILEGGKRLYQGNCAACHQLAGTGSTTIGAPALKGSAVARGSVDVLTRTVLFGRGSMPAFRKSLDDAGLAAILSYVRNAWGNDRKDLVSESRVAAIRAGADLSGRDRSLTPVASRAPG